MGKITFGILKSFAQTIVPVIYDYDPDYLLKSSLWITQHFLDNHFIRYIKKRISVDLHKDFMV
jgi:hypothetical protein